MKEAKWWQPAENNKVLCELCPNNCQIKEGQSGICSVRKNIDGKLYTLVYNNPAVVHVDPIEKKPLYHFFPGSTALSIGTAGCNLQCVFCQNWELARANPEENLSKFMSAENIIDITKKNKCKSIAFTYNEPAVFGEYVLDVSKLAHKSGIKTVMVTNGYISKTPIHDIYPFIDAANIDLKAYSEIFYKKYCKAKFGAVLDAITEIKKLGTFIELTNLIIPDLNDNQEDIKKMLQWIKEKIGVDTPIHFSAFHPSYKMKNHHPTPKNSLDQARETAIQLGFHYVFEGNVRINDSDNTYCPHCGKLLIERKWFNILQNNLDGEQCPCGEKINIKN